ncbi:MAG TPA: penicillin-binding transpeptidase domain-containing protein [Bryobacteraceae bacterium]|nr:penicillin-binding transpeptidase domain-containing protein [Bryobacteraceae bacterium]
MAGVTITRRNLLLSLASCASGSAAAPASLARFFASGEGAAVLIDVRTRRRIAVCNSTVADRFLAPPGSAIKPFVLAALLRTGKLTAAESFPCPGRLRIAGRSFDCSHPRLDFPMRVDTALAYSCNCFVAHVAERFAPGELARELAGLAERVEPVSSVDANRLQALGEEHIRVTTAGLAMAYRVLALRIERPEMQAVMAGLEGAVAYGTARRAGIGGQVAGKTGSVVADSGTPIAWFAGFAPSRAPDAVVAVMLQGHSGGSDAAPIAGRILQAFRAGRL